MLEYIARGYLIGWFEFEIKVCRTMYLVVHFVLGWGNK